MGERRGEHAGGCGSVQMRDLQEATPQLSLHVLATGPFKNEPRDQSSLDENDREQSDDVPAVLLPERGLAKAHVCFRRKGTLAEVPSFQRAPVDPIGAATCCAGRKTGWISARKDRESQIGHLLTDALQRVDVPADDSPSNIDFVWGIHGGSGDVRDLLCNLRRDEETPRTVSKHREGDNDRIARQTL